MRKISAAIKILFTVIAGIITADFSGQYNLSIWIIMLSQLCLLTFLLSQLSKPRFASALIYLLFFVLSFNQHQIRQDAITRSSRFFSLCLEGKCHLSFVIQKLKKSTTQVTVEAKLIRTNGIELSQHKFQGILFIKDSSSLLQEGDTISFFGKLEAFSKPRNPGDFDSKKFYQTLGFTHHAYVNEYELHPKVNDKSIIFSICSTGKLLTNKLQSYIKEPEVLGISSAILLGDKSHLSKQTKELFSNTGSIHVLAVSGLHVGIIYSIIYFILHVLNILQRFKLFSLILIILSLFSYALITGYSNSVIRAASMLSLYLLGKHFLRFTSIYHIVALSALGILMVNTNALFQLSFQFSYLALLGILIFFKRLESLVFIENRAIKMMYQLILVSFSAQFLVSPISLYCFDQFPVYFWLSSLIAIPFAYFIIIVSIVILSLSTIDFTIIHFLSLWIISAYEKMVQLFLYLLDKIDKLPFNNVSDFNISMRGLALTYALIFLIAIWLKAKKIKYLISALTLLLIINAFLIHDKYKNYRQTTLEVYHHHKSTSVAIFDRGTIYTLTNNATPKMIALLSRRKIKYGAYFHKHITLDSIKESSIMSIDSFKILFQLNNSPSKVIINEKVDLAIVKDVDDASLKQIIEYMSPEVILADGSSTYGTRKLLEKCNTELETKIHNTYTDGYLTYHIKT